MKTEKERSLTNEQEPTALEKALAQTETITAQIIRRAEEAEERINILREIQKCVDNNSRHVWEITQVRWENPPFEIKDVQVRCENCMCAMFLGWGDNRLYVELGGVDVPLEEYLIHPTERGATEGEE